MCGTEDVKQPKIRFHDVVKLACMELRRQRTRTLLTLLSIVAGTVLMTLLLSAAWSGYRQLKEEIENSDSLTLIEVWPDPEKPNSLTDNTVEAFQHLAQVEAASGVIDFPAYLEIGELEASVPVRGADPSVLRLSLEKGHMFSENSSQPGIVIGDGALQNLADPESPATDLEGAFGRLRPEVGEGADVRTTRVTVTGIVAQQEIPDPLSIFLLQQPGVLQRKTGELPKFFRIFPDHSVLSVSEQREWIIRKKLWKK